MTKQTLFQAQKQIQTQVLAPQLRQSLKILQAPTLELRHTLLEELATNPVLEELDSSELNFEEAADDLGNHQDELLKISAIQERLEADDESWVAHLAEEARLNPFTSEQNERREHLFNNIPSHTSLENHILTEAKLMGADLEAIFILETLIGSLNDSGFLSISLEELSNICQKPLNAVKKALNLLKNIEPIGLGAPNLQTALLWQLETHAPEETLAIRILKDHYDLLLKRKIPELVKILKTTSQNIHDALTVIASLNPAPGRDFHDDHNHTIAPDIIIEKINNIWTVELKYEGVPKLRLSPLYTALVKKNTLPAHEKNYLKDKIKAGEILIQALQERQSTLKRIGEILLVEQSDFFEKGPRYLKPMTMQIMATYLHLHETTISRAVANKYIQTPYGIFELKHFFSFGYEQSTGDSISSKTVQDRIAQLIAQENPNKPLSDQAIANQLSEGPDALKIARRTVTKYREALNILPTHLRRLHP